MGLILDSNTVEVLCGTLLAFWVIYLYFIKDYGYWEERNVPHVSAVFPFGSTTKLVLGTCSWGTVFNKIYEEFKDEPYVGLIEVRKPSLLIRDPKLVKVILTDAFNHFENHGFTNIHPNDYMVKNLFNLKGQEWRERRVKVTPAYTAAKMKMMFCLVKECSDHLKEYVDKTTEGNNLIDVKDVLTRFTLEIVASCAFGIELKSLSNTDMKFLKIAKKAINIDYKVLLKMFAYNAFPIFSKVHCFDLQDPEFKKFFTDLVRSTVEYREKHNISRCDFLDFLIKLRQNQRILEGGEKPGDNVGPNRSATKEGLTIEEITSESFLVFTAGFEFTSNITQFSLHELACNHHIQNTLYAEVREVLNRHGHISYQALQEMTYMDQVIYETIRRYPVFPQLFRTCTENFRIPNSTLVVEKDMRVIIPAYFLHHDPQYFPDPYTFDPERFSTINHKERHSFVFLPFGEGPRMCIGFRFGLMKVKTALATLICDYEISLTPDAEVPLKMKSNAFTTLPSKPIVLVFKRRFS